jgi:hypothetical protein
MAAPNNKTFPLVRGRVMRATRLDACGRIADRACSSIVSEGVVSVALTAIIDEGEEINVTNMAGRSCAKDTPDPTFNGYGVAITFCDVDPQLYAMMTNQSVVYDIFGTAVGFRVNSKVKTGDANFALEVWTNVPGVACDDANAAGSFGYTLFPFIKGGVLGDFTIENAAVSFTLTNAATRDGNAWGKGPYNVVPSVGGTSEVQTVTTTGTPTGGTFTLTFGGQSTTPLAYNAPAATVQTALLALSNLDTGDVVVGGGPGPGTPYTFTFGGNYAKEDVPAMTATHAYSGGTAPTIAVTTGTPGVGPTAGPLVEALDVDDHLHVQYTTVAPPDVSENCVASGPAATGATAGIPATITPVDSYPPETLALLQATPLTATPATAWTTGQYLLLGNGTKAYWNGTSWVTGTAP